jgi:hypothetical protein
VILPKYAVFANYMAGSARCLHFTSMGPLPQ